MSVNKLKLMQTFVMKKFLLLMAGLLFKWPLLTMLQISFCSVFLSTPAIDAMPFNITVHPFFVSVTEFNHNQKEKTIEISCKMFAEDFENTLKTHYKTNIDIAHPKDTKLVEKYVYEYLQKHLQLKINSKIIAFQFIGFEKEDEAVWVYLQINNVSVVKKMEVMNNILYESYNTQISIMHASVGGARKSTRLVYPDTQASFEF